MSLGVAFWLSSCTVFKGNQSTLTKSKHPQKSEPDTGRAQHVLVKSDYLPSKARKYWA